MSEINPALKKFTRAQLRAIPVANYHDEVRPQLQTGDLLMCSGNGVLSWLIAKGTKSAFSHIGMIVRLHEIDRVYLLESSETGVRFAPLSKFLGHEGHKGYDGALVIAKMGGLSDAQRLDLARHGSDHLTQPYGYWNMVLFTLKVWFNIRFRTSKREYLCSELIESCYGRLQGFAKFRHSMKGFVSPRDIWSDERVSYLARVR